MKFKTKNKIKSLLIHLIFILGSISAFSQNYPVQVNTQLIPPYSLHLSDYVSPGTNRISSTILLNDLTVPNYQVYLKLFIEGDGIQIITSDAYRPSVDIQGGVPYFMSSADLASYFDINNLNFSGISRQEYQQSGKLPEGIYRFSIRVYDYNKNIAVSNSGSMIAWLMLNDPPIINIPQVNEKVRATFPQNIFFQWMPRHMGSPNSAFTTEYELSLVEIWPKGTDPNIAIMTGVPIYQETTMNTSFYYGVMQPALEPGREYAYRVQARDMDNRDMFKNDGYSEVRMFTFGDECKLVENMDAEPDGSYGIIISWTAAFGQSMFNVQYRKANVDDAEWFEEETYMEEITIDDLEPDTEYEYRVMGYCGSINGDYSPENTIKTNPYDPPDFDCGANSDTVLVENTTPLASLSEGTIITSGDFRITVLEVTGGGGTFSGSGLALVPYLGFISVPVEFEGIKINEEKQVYEGIIISKYDENSPFVIDPRDIFGGDDEDDNTDSITVITDDIIDTETGDSIVVTGPIDTVIVVDDVIIVVADGDTTYYEDNDIIIVDDSDGGDTYTVTDGVVTTGGGSGSGGGDGPGGETDDPAGEVNVFVTFKEFPEQVFGFDPYNKDIQGSPFGMPEQIQGKEYYLSYKAMGQGGLDHVYAQIEFEDTTYKPEDVKFKNMNGFTLSSEPVDENTRKISLIGEVHKTLSDIVAYVNYTDTSGTEQEKIVGKLKQISYEKETYQMKLVPVNMDPSKVDADYFAQLTTKIYGQANVEWQVTLENRFDISTTDWDKNDDGKVDDSESSLFSLYTKEMNNIIGKYKKAANPDDNTYYLLLLGDLSPASGNLAGYMPFKQQYGLIFIPVTGTDATSLSRIVAHEVGHGAFRLYHTFSSQNPYTEPKGQTNNLMDYNNGTHLHKYQWDYIHDPQAMIAWAQDDDESASIGDELGKKYDFLFNHIYSKNNSSNTEYINKINEKIGSGDESFELEIEDSELSGWSEEEKEWLKEWKVRIYNKTKVYDDILSSIKNAQMGKKIPKITARKNRVYIGNYNYEGLEFNIAVYGRSENFPMENILTKIMVGEIDDLKLPEIRKHFYLDVGEKLNYWIISFFEEDKLEPSLTIQISGEYSLISAGHWLEYLNILNPKLNSLDISDNFDWMNEIDLDNENISNELLEKLIENRNSVNNRSDKSIYGNSVLKDYSDGNVYYGNDKGSPTFTGTEFEKEVKKEIYNELGSEGSYSSINTYDDEHLTWGKGFSITGELMNVLENLINNTSKDYNQIFNNLGIKIVNKKLWILDDDGNWKKDSPPNYEASDYIASDSRLLSFFIELAEKPEYYQDVIDAQYKAIVSGAGDYPSYILNSDKSGYNENWNHSSVTVLCHLSHWAGFRWHEGDDRYKDTQGDLDKILYKYLYYTLVNYSGMRSGNVLESSIYKWNSSYNILRNLSNWGNPKSVGKDKLGETWNSHSLELEFKNDGSDKERAVKKNSTNYISNSECILIKNDTNYLIITKDANKITFKVLEE